MQLSVLFLQLARLTPTDFEVEQRFLALGLVSFSFVDGLAILLLEKCIYRALSF